MEKCITCEEELFEHEEMGMCADCRDSCSETLEDTLDACFISSY